MRSPASRTFCSGIDPRLNQLSKQLLRAGSGNASNTGVPPPGNEVVAGGMLLEEGKIPAAVALRVLYLLANFSHRLSLPRHFDRSQPPTRVTGNALICCTFVELEIGVRMAFPTGVARHSDASLSARDKRHMRMAVIALRGSIVCRVAIHTARTCDHPGCFAEQRTRTHRQIADRGEFRRASQRCFRCLRARN